MTERVGRDKSSERRGRWLRALLDSGPAEVHSRAGQGNGAAFSRDLRAQ
jgi:hypothetical protein